MKLSKSALALTGLMTILAIATFGNAVHHRQPNFDSRFWTLLVLSVVTARLKVKLPGLTGNMSVNLPFLLIAVTQLSLLAALLVALPSCGVQSLPKGRGELNPVQMIFNIVTTAVAVGVASAIGTHSILLAAVGFFFAQTIPVAGIISLTEGAAIPGIWLGIANMSFSFYVLSAGIISIAATSLPHFGWQAQLAMLPLMYGIYHSYQSYFRVPQLAR